MAPLIVLTNDDGIDSPGLRASASALAQLGDLLIVAPSRQQTSMGRAFHGRGRAYPIIYRVNRKRVRAFAVATSPAVAVRHAVLLIAETKPALVVSGINYGENIGSGVTISATVGAALEAACLGVPALATSLETEPQYHRTHSPLVDFTIAGHFTRMLAQRILTHGLPPGADLLNLNVPSGATTATPWRWTRVSRQSYFRSKVVETRIGRRFRGYELNVQGEKIEPNTDIYAIRHDHVVSVSPLTIDLTAHTRPAELERWGKE